MTKAELLTKVSEKVAQKVENVSKKQVAETVDALFDTLKEVLCSKDEAASRLSYPGFGTFTVKQRAERKGRNPHTKEEIQGIKFPRIQKKLPCRQEYRLHPSRRPKQKTA